MPRNPHAARLVKRQKHKPGNLQDLLKVVWQALLEAEAVMVSVGDDAPELTLKAVHAVIQAGATYAKLLEVGELEARLQLVERAVGGHAA